MIGNPATETYGIAPVRETMIGPRLDVVECSTCGFTPDDQITTNRGRCPKCSGFAWRRVKQSHGSLVLYAAAEN